VGEQSVDAPAETTSPPSAARVGEQAAEAPAETTSPPVVTLGMMEACITSKEELRAARWLLLARQLTARNRIDMAVLPEEDDSDCPKRSANLLKRTLDALRRALTPLTSQPTLKSVIDDYLEINPPPQPPGLWRKGRRRYAQNCPELYALANESLFADNARPSTTVKLLTFNATAWQDSLRKTKAFLMIDSGSNHCIASRTFVNKNELIVGQTGRWIAEADGSGMYLHV
jgi:hypothetical protein